MLESIGFDCLSKRSLRRWAFALSLASLVLMLSGCASMGRSRPDAVTVPQIIAMARSGLSADEIISKIEASGTVYRLKASQLAELEKEGVPAKVIDYMQGTYLKAVERDTRYQDEHYWTHDNDYMYGGDPYGWGDEGGLGDDDDGGGDRDDRGGRSR